ncbi:hypothetical protein HYD55_02450 [Mycoplasmopsis bovis]|nr:hypothetical protein [Mycoplasmopsis bovis]QQH71620.1 hypothetical protein HYD55_02450 [Mycoplasmopsis bovis]
MFTPKTENGKIRISLSIFRKPISGTHVLRNGCYNSENQDTKASINIRNKRNQVSKIGRIYNLENEDSKTVWTTSKTLNGRAVIWL